MAEIYQIKTEIFEGPLDLLLHLIEKRKLHISDISLASITDDYLAHIEKLEHFPIGEAANFILIASTLVLIKSRALLPALALTKEEEENIEDLERRLKEYRQIKQLGIYVQEQFGKTPIFFKEPPRNISPVFSPTKEITRTNLFIAIKNILHTLPKKEMIPQVVIEKIISVEETIENLAQRMSKTLSVSFKEFAHSGGKSKVNIIVGFLAILELIKRGIITVKQKRSFEDIIMEKK